MGRAFARPVGFAHPTILVGFAQQPFLHGIAHGLAVGSLHPRHERAIEFEMIAAFLPEETPDVPRVAIGLRDRRLAGDEIAVPVERFQSVLPLARFAICTPARPTTGNSRACRRIPYS